MEPAISENFWQVFGSAVIAAFSPISKRSTVLVIDFETPLTSSRRHSMNTNNRTKVAKSYATALEEQARARTEFSKEYWNGKTFGIVETYAEMMGITWKQAETELKRALR